MEMDLPILPFCGQRGEASLCPCTDCLTDDQLVVEANDDGSNNNEDDKEIM